MIASLVSSVAAFFGLRPKNEPENPCPRCGQEMEYGVIDADCAGGSHREISGWFCEPCDYSEREQG